MSDVQFHAMPDGRRIAYRFTPGAGPAIVFLPGYMSDMAGSKAMAVFDQAQAAGRACLLLDYSGCGATEGEFADGTLSRWREEVVALVGAVIEGPVVLTGSSMGGWLMLLVGEQLGERLAGLVGIAAAPDFAEWGYYSGQKARLAAGETIFQDNPYGPAPTPTHARFWQDAMGHLRLAREIALDCPTRLIHGQRDDNVPWETSLRLAHQLRSGDIQVALVKDGDHRLSRRQDIALLLRQIWSLFD
mgnify:CR=1 FL=1